MRGLRKKCVSSQFKYQEGGCTLRTVQPKGVDSVHFGNTGNKYTLRYENESPPGNKVVRFEELMKMGATPRTQ